MERFLVATATHNWVFGATLVAAALTAVLLAGLAGYCTWAGMPIPATHAAAASFIVARRVRLMVLQR